MTRKRKAATVLPATEETGAAKRARVVAGAPAGTIITPATGPCVCGGRLCAGQAEWSVRRGPRTRLVSYACIGTGLVEVEA